MSGNPTNKLLETAYFIDTCVYINYGVALDVFHDESRAFFAKKEEKYTSESVLKELDDFQGFLSRFGRDLSIALKQGRRSDILNYPWAVFKGYGENAQGYILKFLIFVKNRNAEDILKEYRSAKGLTIDRIKSVLDETQSPCISQSNDEKFIRLISYVNDDADAQIIADAALWATNYSYRTFCTSDNEHILENKTHLALDITKNYGRNCLVFIHVKDVT